MWIERRKDRLLACERFTDEAQGKQIKLTVTLSNESPQAKRKALRTLNEKWEAMCRLDKDYKLSQIAEKYFKDAEDRLKPHTITRDKGNINRFIEIVGDIYVDRVKASYIKEKLKTSGKSNTTLNGYIKNFKIVMRWAYKNEYTDNIACVDRLENFADRTKREKIKDKFLETEELTTLIEAMTCDHWKLLTEFLALTGMRIGEALALTNDDVDLFNKVIRINKTLVPSTKAISTAKTLTSNREIHIQKELFQVANKIKKYSNEMRMLTGVRNDIFFVNPQTADHVVYGGYAKYLRENSIAVLGRPVSPHVLRHTFTSIYAERGLSLEQISRHLGHSDSRITKDIYYHVTSAQRQKDAAELDKVRIFAH